MSKVPFSLTLGIWPQKILLQKPQWRHHHQAQGMLRYLRLRWQWKHLRWRTHQHHQSPRHWKSSSTNHQHRERFITRCWDGLWHLPRYFRIRRWWKQRSFNGPIVRNFWYPETRQFWASGILKSRRLSWRELLSCWSWSNDRLRWQRQRRRNQLRWIHQRYHQRIPQGVICIHYYFKTFALS